MTVRFGLIGAGGMAAIHARAIADAAGGSLVAVAGGTRAPALAAEHGVEHVASPDQLMERADIDAVVLATPHTTHLPLTLAAAAAGKHVFLEKPMALDVAECDAMIDACRRADRRLMVAHVTRFMEATRVAHDLVERGSIGALRMIQVWRLVDGYPNSGWTLDPAEGSAFLDWGAHGCDIIRWFVGSSPWLAFGRFTSYRGGMPTGLSGMAEFAFDGDVVANVWQSYEMPGIEIGARARYLFVGSEGLLDLHSYGQVTRADRDGAVVVYQQPDFTGPNYLMDPFGPYFRTAFASQIQEFIDAVVEERDPSVSGEDGRAAIEMVEAVERSAATAEAVRLASGGAHR